MFGARIVNTCSMNAFTRKTALERSFQRSFARGKSAFARFIDQTAFCTLIGLGCFILSRSSRVMPLPSVFIGLVAAIAAFITSDLVFKERFSKHIRAKAVETKSALRREKILLESESVIAEALTAINAAFPGASVALPRKAAPLTEDDVYETVREERSKAASGQQEGRLIIITLCPPSASAVRLAERIRESKIEFISAEQTEALKKAFPVTREEVEEAIISEYPSAERPRFQNLRKRLSSTEFLQTGAGKYALLGVSFLAASFFMRYKLYFRSAAMLCFALYVRLKTYERLKLLRRHREGS